MFKKISKSFSDKLDDVNFYKSLYIDLKNMSNTQLLNHWNNYGKNENRFFYFEDFLSFYNITTKDFEDFDFDFYILYYEDLNKKFTNKYQAIHHYLEYGKKEKRIPNLKNLLEVRDIDNNIINQLLKYFDHKDISNIKSFNTEDITLSIFLDNITGLSFKPIKVNDDDIVNSNFYLLAAENFLIKESKNIADNYLNLSLSFRNTDKNLEYKGNLNLDFNSYNDAIMFYEEALKINKQLKFVYINLSESYEKSNDIKNAINTLINGISEIPTYTERYIEKINILINRYYIENKNNIFNKFLINNNRELLIEQMNILSKYIYDVYFNIYRGFDKIQKYNTINMDKVLIIGDFHVEQCIRYRIDQKMEQLKAQNFEVESISWTELDQNAEKVNFYDIVIFYRVPSKVEIIKTISKINALNKISIYEIDDLIFESSYPDDIKNYGGSIGLDTYYGLTVGMSKMNSAAKLCNYGLASTIPLQKKLEKLVSKKVCLLHRNGLDSLNSFEKVDKNKKDTIDLFYGSGTLAHNEDFIDLVLPAVIKIMNEFKNTRIIILGHLNLPKSFLDKFKSRVITLPKVKINAYYSYLKQADINIAVLHKDDITDCKSELKWFEAGCYSIPSVVSNTQNYLDVIKENEDGFIANNSEQWYLNLKKLIENKQLRETIGSNVLNRIKDEYNVEVLGSTLSKNIKTLIDQNYTKYNKKRKKIALVNVFFPPQSIGGATRVVSDNFDVLIDSYSDEYEICVFTSEVECLEPYKMSMYNYKGARVYKANILYRENMDWHAEDKNMYNLFQEFLEVENPDKVHFHCVQRLTASVVEATKDKEIPYLVTVHDAWWISDHQFLVDKNNKVYPDGHPDPFYTRVLPNNVTLDMSMEREMYLKSLLNNAEHVLTVSESFAKIYRGNGIPNIGVTKNGISSKIDWIQKDTSNTKKVVCGHIGGMSSHKGYDILKKAVVKSELKNLEFLVVDHSKEESYVSFEKWGNTEVKFIGRQKQEDMIKVYGQIDVLFAPSIWPESFGLVTREASACGCWIVAGNLGGIGEDVIDGKNGFVIEPTQNAIYKTIKVIDSKYKNYKGIAPKGNVFMVEEQVEILKEFLND